MMVMQLLEAGLSAKKTIDYRAWVLAIVVSFPEADLMLEYVSTRNFRQIIFWINRYSYETTSFITKMFFSD
jgi:hypothetical protein